MPLLRLFIPGLALAAAALSYAAAVHDRLPGDLRISLWIQKIDFAGLTKSMELLSALGNPYVMAIVGVVFAGYLIYRHRRSEGFVLLLLVALTLVSTYLLKELIDRPRPSAELVRVWKEYSGMSFPSGTTLNSVVVLGALTYLVRSMISVAWGFTLARGMLVVVVFLIGSSRIFLGAHWPSDVLGGFVLGGLFLSLFILFVRQSSRPSS